MRLTDQEVHAIKDTAAKWFGDGAIIRVFGSRTRDDSRGGDIDLHIVAESKERADLRSELAFNVDLQTRIGEQKIDVILRTLDAQEQPIDRIALATGIVL